MALCEPVGRNSGAKRRVFRQLDRGAIRFARYCALRATLYLFARQSVRRRSDMFENVPQHLTNYLRAAASDFDRESFYYFAAAYLGVFYLKRNFTKPETSN